MVFAFLADLEAKAALFRVHGYNRDILMPNAVIVHVRVTVTCDTVKLLENAHLWALGTLSRSIDTLTRLSPYTSYARCVCCVPALNLLVSGVLHARIHLIITLSYDSEN